ncbi:hypothetical protein SAMN05216436_105124 [bacterium A37T11]|nr:hypothetical protein SAMN05216436_105124 [bacterium A37T11]
METLIVQPQNAEQVNGKDNVPVYVVAGLKDSVQEVEEGKLVIFSGVRDMLDLK